MLGFTPKERYPTEYREWKQFDQFGHKLETPNDRFSVLNAVLSASEAALLSVLRFCDLGHLSHFREYEGFLITYLYQKILDYR